MNRPTVLRYRSQSTRERRGYFLLAFLYCIAAVIRAAYELAHGGSPADVAPRLVVRLVLAALILLLVVKYRDSAGVADSAGVRGFAQKDVAWPEVAAVTTQDDEAVLVLTDGTRRRTRFPVSYAKRLAELGGKPLR